MFNKYTPFLFLLLLLLPLCIIAQNDKYSTKSQKAIKYYENATANMQFKKYQDAEKDLGKAIKADSLFIEAWLLLGDLFCDLKKNAEAITSYNKAITIDPDFYPGVYYFLGNLYFGKMDYEDAKDNYLKFISYKTLEKPQLKKISRIIANCNFAIKAMKNSVPFNPVNLGDSINSPNSEYLPSLTADEQTLVITVRRPGDENTIGSENAEEEDFYISHKLNGIWTKARKMPAPLNSHGNEGAQAISPDGQFMIFTACDRNDGQGSCDLYFSRKTGDKWSKPVNMGEPVNTPYWESQPSISSDGRTIYFASSRKGGKGGSDIWSITMDDEGKFSVPVNLGDSINTEGNEMSPFIHPDDRTLYFSSNGLPGMGGMDIYFSRRDNNGRWTKPVNLGYPINTSADEINLVVNTAGNMAYFSSDKPGGKGKQDLYCFELYEDARPTPVTYMKGIVYNSVTKEKLSADFELIDVETGKSIVKSISDAITGAFLVCLPADKNYALNVSKEGYLFYSDNFQLTGSTRRTDPYLKDIPLKPIKVGESVVLKNIFFDTDKYDLKSESLAELQKLLDLLKKNPRMKIEISGHTDNIGTKEYNITLSLNRSKTVYDYLTGQGVAASRISYKGFGFELPIDTNDTEEGRANNRRTEFKVTEYY